MGIREDWLIYVGVSERFYMANGWRQYWKSSPRHRPPTEKLCFTCDEIYCNCFPTTFIVYFIEFMMLPWDNVCLFRKRLDVFRDGLTSRFGAPLWLVGKSFVAKVFPHFFVLGFSNLCYRFTFCVNIVSSKSLYSYTCATSSCLETGSGNVWIGF